MKNNKHTLSYNQFSKIQRRYMLLLGLKRSFLRFNLPLMEKFIMWYIDRHQQLPTSFNKNFYQFTSYTKDYIEGEWGITAGGCYKKENKITMMRRYLLCFFNIRVSVHGLPRTHKNIKNKSVV